MRENMITVRERSTDAALVHFDVVKVDGGAYQVKWTVPGTPESVQDGTVGKVFRNHLIASVWARREAECYASDNGGIVNGYAPSFNIWDAKYDS